MIGMDEEPKRLVVRRPDPPPEDGDAPRPARARLTPEEARALLAVTVVRKGPWDKVKPRLRMAFLASFFASVLVRLTLGFHSFAMYIVEGLSFVALLGWVVWPIVFAEKDDWT